MVRNSAKNSLSVTELAAYAASPRDFCAHKGGAYNKKSARFGIQQHARVGRRPRWLRFVTAGILLVLMYFVVHHFLGW